VNLPRRVADRAAKLAAAELGVAQPIAHLGSSMAATYATGGVVLRVTDDVLSAAATLASATAARRWVRTPVALSPVPLSIQLGGGVTASVEVYERLYPCRAPTPAEIGEALAELHLASAGATLPPTTRLAVSRARLDAVLQGPWRRAAVDLAANLDAVAELCAALDSPHCLVHGDVSAANLLVDDAGVAWIDWEYAGAGPAALDVALAVGEMWRFSSAAAAADLLSAYVTAGGIAPVEHVVLLSGVRDVVGAADVFPPRPSEAWERLACQRIGSLSEAARSTRWAPLASLDEVPPGT
jgi:Ser/Thr protein kinase RdoA (MazF antagonist)